MPAGVRLVLRDDAAAPGCARTAEAWPDARVLAYRPGLTPASLVEAVAEVARETGLRRKGLYERALAARAAGEGTK